MATTTKQISMLTLVLTVLVQAAGENQTLAQPSTRVNITGQWIKGPAGQSRFDDAAGTPIRMQLVPGGVDMIYQDQSVRYARYPGQRNSYTAQSARYLSSGAPIQTPRGFETWSISVIDRDNLVQFANNNTYYFRRSGRNRRSAQVIPQQQQVDLTGRWSKGQPGVQRSDSSQGREFEVRMTQQGFVMTDGTYSANYGAVPGQGNQYRGLSIVHNLTNQLVTPPGMNGWRFMVVDPNTLVQQANGNTYYLRRMRPGQQRGQGGGGSRPSVVNAGPTGSQLSQQQALQVVQLHNTERAQVGVAPLQWSNELAASAQSWAEQLARMNVMQHSSTTHGENLYSASAFGNASRATLSPAAAVQSWASEKRLYSGQAINGFNFNSFGHYTQMVWRTTTKVGCGMASAADGTVYIVCQYDPAGNTIGQRPF